MELHHTHNISCSSSETLNNRNNKNNKSSSSSSEKDIYERSKSINDWSNLLLNDNINQTSLRFIEENQMNITARSYESNYEQNEEMIKNENIGSKSSRTNNKNKNNGYIKRFDFKNTKYIYDRFGKKFRVLKNGILLKKVNKGKKFDEHPFKRNEIIISNKKKNNFNRKPLKRDSIQNKIMNEMNYINPDPKISLLLQKAQKEDRKDSFHILYIKKPSRSFITKVYQYKEQPLKKLNANSGRFKKIKAYSNRIPSSSKKLLVKRQEIKSKIFDNNHNSLIPKLIENNTENKFVSLSTASNKKYTLNSNASIYLNKSNLKKNNTLQKRPSSVIVKKEVNFNYKGSKIDNYNYNITGYNKSYNQKFMSSIGSTNGNKSMKSIRNNYRSIIYENMNFAKQLKELKTYFEFYQKKNNCNINNKVNKNHQYKIFREHLNNANLENTNSEKIITRKLNSAKVKNSSYHIIYPKEISPLYDGFQIIKLDEEEKQSKQNNFHNKFGYQKHFGNENTCPICITLKENNLLREESLNNKNYYFPFKDKNETNHISLTSKHNHQKSFNNIFKKNKEKNFVKQLNNQYYINNMSIEPVLRSRKNLNNEQKYKGMNKNISNLIENYDALQKYFL